MTLELVYFTKAGLIKANNLAIKHNFNSSLNPEKLKQLEPNYRYPVSTYMEHNDHIRACVVLSQVGETGWLDIPWELFEKLPRMKAIKHTIH